MPTGQVMMRPGHVTRRSWTSFSINAPSGPNPLNGSQSRSRPSKPHPPCACGFRAKSMRFWMNLAWFASEVAPGLVPAPPDHRGDET